MVGEGEQTADVATHTDEGCETSGLSMSFRS